MTFYVRVKEEVAPKPMLIKDRLTIGYGSTWIYSGQTLEVEEGTEVIANVAVRNDGGQGKVAVQLWDEKNKREIFWKEYDLSAGGQRIEGVKFTVDADMDLKYYTYYWDGSKWIPVDSHGCPEDKPNIRGYLSED